MAEEVIKVIENVDELFPEIVVNGESHVSERYVEPPQASIPASTPQTQETEPTYPQQTVQGEYVDTLNLNGVEHDLKDSPLSAEVQALQTLLGTIQSRLNELSALIPSQASAQNQLADKNFVNSSIATNTANFLGTYTSLADIEAIQNPTNNDYAFLQTTDSVGNTKLDRYKYNSESSQWLYEYTLNNSSFTAEQWATINSGLTTSSVSDAIGALDVASVGGSGKYIESISEVDGKIVPVEASIATSVALNNLHSVTSNAVYESMGIIWQGIVTMASDITSVYNWCKTHHIGSRVCGFIINSEGQASSEPFGTSSVTVIYCMSSANYGWIQGLSDKADCNMAMAYINDSVSAWQRVSINNFFGFSSSMLTDPIKNEIRSQFNNTAQYTTFRGETMASNEGAWWGYRHSSYGCGIFISRGQFVAFYLDADSFRTKVFMDGF